MPMTEEERAKQVPKALLSSVYDFNRASDTIFNEFDKIRDNYLAGKDIMEDLEEFRSKRPGIFMLIYDIFHKEVELEHKLDMAKVQKEKRDKLVEFKNRFADLAEELDLLVLSESGIGK